MLRRWKDSVNGPWIGLESQVAGMEADDLLCSRNARLKKALVGRAQWKINQPPSLRDNERAWKEDARAD
jgi:hypothetical protein